MVELNRTRYPDLLETSQFLFHPQGAIPDVEGGCCSNPLVRVPQAMPQASQPTVRQPVLAESSQSLVAEPQRICLLQSTQPEDQPTTVMDPHRWAQPVVDFPVSVELAQVPLFNEIYTTCKNQLQWEAIAAAMAWRGRSVEDVVDDTLGKGSFDTAVAVANVKQNSTENLRRCNQAFQEDDGDQAGDELLETNNQGTSKYKGVTKNSNKSRNKWTATLPGDRYIGTYATPIEAARARRNAMEEDSDQDLDDEEDQQQVMPEENVEEAEEEEWLPVASAARARRNATNKEEEDGELEVDGVTPADSDPVGPQEGQQQVDRSESPVERYDAKKA